MTDTNRTKPAELFLKMSARQQADCITARPLVIASWTHQLCTGAGSPDSPRPSIVRAPVFCRIENCAPDGTLDGFQAHFRPSSRLLEEGIQDGVIRAFFDEDEGFAALEADVEGREGISPDTYYLIRNGKTWTLHVVEDVKRGSDPFHPYYNWSLVWTALVSH